MFSDYLKAQGVDNEHIIKVDFEDRRNKKLRNPDTLLEYIDAMSAKIPSKQKQKDSNL